MDDHDVLAEVCTWHLQGRVYYRHEAKLLFSANLLTVGGLERAPQLEAELPEGAEVYAPREGSRTEARLDTWTDLCDAAAEQAHLTSAELLADLGEEAKPCR